MQRFAVFTSILLALSATAYRQPTSRGSHVRRYAAVSNELGYRLQREQSYKTGNQLLSPYGISTVLSAVYEGSGGSSRQQLGRLGYSALEQQGVDLLQSYEQLRRYLQRSSRGSQLEEANVFLYPSDYSVSPQYQEVLESSYRCLVQQVGHGQESGHKEVNHWVQRQTNGKISQIVDEVDASSGIALLNGIYYQGQLQSQSSQRQQQQIQFQNEGEGSQQSVLYYETQSRYPYYQDEQLQAVQLPYQGGDYSLLVVLPSQQNGIRQVQQQVSYSTFQSIISRSQTTEVRVSIPQFRLDYSRQLQQDIQSLGVTSIFESDAQLSDVISSGGAYVSQIVQRAVVEVGEYGSQQVYRYEAGQGFQYGAGQGFQYGAGQGDQYQHEYRSGQDSQYGASLGHGYQGSQGERYGLGQDDQYGAEELYGFRSGQRYQYGGSHGEQHGVGNDQFIQKYGYSSDYQDDEGVAQFQADRPFLFYIIHKQTGLNLLAGRISEL